MAKITKVKSAYLERLNNAEYRTFMAATGTCSRVAEATGIARRDQLRSERPAGHPPRSSYSLRRRFRPIDRRREPILGQRGDRADVHPRQGEG